MEKENKNEIIDLKDKSENEKTIILGNISMKINKIFEKINEEKDANKSDNDN